MKNPSNVLMEMIVTEKATEQSSEANQYTFRVYPSSNRIAVADAVERTFGVSVERVRMMNVKRKQRRDRTRRGKVGYKSGYKKAVVSLKRGDSIDLI